MEKVRQRNLASGLPYFHRACDYFMLAGERLTLTGDDHKLVWDWFRRPGADSVSERIGRLGERLRRARRRADYDPTKFSDLSREAERMVIHATDILADLRRLR